MLCDYESAWLQLRRRLTVKSGHGTFGPGGLLAIMAELELDCAIEEGPTERALRLFGIQLSEDLLQIVETATGEEPNGHKLSSGDHTDSRGAESSAHRHRSTRIPIHH